MRLKLELMWQPDLNPYQPFLARLAEIEQTRMG